MTPRFWPLFAAALCALAGSAAQLAAQSTVNGTDLPLSSAGSTSLTDPGYLGTYLTVPAGGATINFSVNATEGSTGAGSPPHLNIVVADSSLGFFVGNTSPVNYLTSNVHLPGGTYFVRAERDYASNTSSTRPITLNTLTVNTVSGAVATLSGTGSGTDANALAAANTYITNFRQGPATVHLVGAPNGAPVQVDMTRNAFNFGGTVSGVTFHDSKDMLLSNPGPTTEAAQFQSFINQYFNTLVPSNGGKWASNEPTQNNVNMQLVDEQLNYAQAHNMEMRMHNLLWGSGATSGSQQPTFVNNLLSAAAGGDATAKANLSTAITNRISYYVGGTNLGNAKRAAKYIEIDVLNEALHNPSYWNIYSSGGSPTGVANIYNQVAAAITAAGSNAKTYLNEYNVLQFSPNTITSTGAQSGSDPYANWYRNEVEAVRSAGGNVGGIGMQLYASAASGSLPTTSTMQMALQNLSVDHLPLTMAEFGLGSSTTQSNRDTNGPGILDNAMRMFYGNPLANTFMVWGWWDTAASAAPSAQMVITTPGASTYALTLLGQKWVDLMNEFSTHLDGQDADHAEPLVQNGAINFTGYYGDYEITIGGKTYPLTLTKGTTDYTIVVPEPSGASLAVTAVCLLALLSQVRRGIVG